MSAIPNRVRPGVPTGGQFSSRMRPEASGLDLSDLDLVDLPEDGPDLFDPPAPAVLPPSADPPAIDLSTLELVDLPEEGSSFFDPPPPAVETGQFPGLHPDVAARMDPAVFDDARKAIAFMQANPTSVDAAAAAELAVCDVGRAVDSAVFLQEVKNQSGLDLPDPFDPDLDANRVRQSRQAVLEVLGAVRPLGLPDGESLITVDSHKPAERLINAAAAQFPSEWLASSQALRTPLRARISTGRNHYISAKSYTQDGGTKLREGRAWAAPQFSPPPDATNVERNEHGVSWTEVRPVKVKTYKVAAVITVPSPGKNPNSAARVATHELTHRMENANDRLGRLEQAFLNRRCVDENGNSNRPHAYKGIYRKERIRDGGFVDEYTGKIYPGLTYREVLSTGAEAIFNGHHGGLTGRGGGQADQDHRAFVLGCLAVA